MKPEIKCIIDITEMLFQIGKFCRFGKFIQQMQT